MDWTLAQNNRFAGAKGPVVLVILDGVGIGRGDESDAVALARTPVLDAIANEGLRCQLIAHGTKVGLPSDDDMGNSEVGHNALGCGRIHDQGAALVDKAIANGTIYEGDAWQTAMRRCAAGGALHLIGLLSDGNVHSHIHHAIALLKKAAKSGAKKLYVHALLDGRDVPPQSALEYVETLENVLKELRASGVSAYVASGGGRMTTTMDRYEADWGMVERGFRAHVHGDAPNRFASLAQAVSSLRQGEGGTVDDQFLSTFVIVDNAGNPIGPMHDGDSVFLTNFRGDRALEISQAFEATEFPFFDRGAMPELFFAGMMEYDGDSHVPASYLVKPPQFRETMGEWLVHNKVTQLAISETQKFGHVTYFWNGNRSGAFDARLETYIEIPSDDVPFEQRPWMKAAEITDVLIQELRTGKHRFVRVNYANGDMVGHTGDREAAITAVQVLDLQLKRLKKAIDAVDGILVITADHGNADEMYQHSKDGQILRHKTGAPMVKTSHTLNPVPFLIHDGNHNNLYEVESRNDSGIANVTSTCLELLGFVPPPGFEPSLLRFAHDK